MEILMDQRLMFLFNMSTITFWSCRMKFGPLIKYLEVKLSYIGTTNKKFYIKLFSKVYIFPITRTSITKKFYKNPS